MVEFWPDLVVFVSISVGLMEIYRRILARRLLRRVLRAFQALETGQDTADAVVLRTLAERAGGALAGILVAKGDDDRWHLTKTARVWGGRALQAVGELAKSLPKGEGGPVGIGALLAGGAGLDQLAAVGISSLPKRYQGWAAMFYPIVKPFLERFAGGSTKKKTEGGSSEVPTNVKM